MSSDLAYGRDLAGAYDSRHFGGASGAFILERDLTAVSSLLPRPPADLLDVPCGTGVYLAALHAAHYAVTGVDASLPMLHMTAKQAPSAFLLEADIRKLPFPDASFDGTLTLRLFSHFPTAELEPMLQELRRVLRPGGRLVFDTFAWSPRHWPVVNRFLNPSYIYPLDNRSVFDLVSSVGLHVEASRALYLFSPIWQRKLPLPMLKLVTALECFVPNRLLLRTFWSCSRIE